MGLSADNAGELQKVLELEADVMKVDGLKIGFVGFCSEDDGNLDWVLLAWEKEMRESWLGFWEIKRLENKEKGERDDLRSLVVNLPERREAISCVC